MQLHRMGGQCPHNGCSLLRWTLLISLNNVLVVVVTMLLLPGAQTAESEVYYYNDIRTCKSNEYFDVNYLNCKKCETEANLWPRPDSKYCFIDYIIITCR